MNNTISSLASLLPLCMAQLPAAKPTEIGTWLLSAAAVTVIASQGIALWNQITGRFKERETSGPSYVQVRDCTRSHTDLATTIEKQEDRHQQRTEALRLEIKNDIKGVHDRINEVLAGVSRVEGKVNQ